MVSHKVMVDRSSLMGISILVTIKTIKEMDMALYLVQMDRSFFKVFGKMIISKRWKENSNELINSLS